MFDKIINNVDEILKIKAKDINNDTREFEEEIDRVVYWLYGLSEGEIRVIEGK